MASIQRDFAHRDDLHVADQRGCARPGGLLRPIALDGQNGPAARFHQCAAAHAGPEPGRGFDAEREKPVGTTVTPAAQPEAALRVEMARVPGPVPDLPVFAKFGRGVVSRIQIALVDVIADDEDLILPNGDADAVDRTPGQQARP